MSDEDDDAVEESARCRERHERTDRRCEREDGHTGCHQVRLSAYAILSWEPMTFALNWLEPADASHE